jgi:hypothetical protein
MKTMRNRMKRRGRAVLATALYGLYALVWLVAALAHLWGDAARTPLSLEMAAAETRDMMRQPDGTFLTSGVDPQFIFRDIDAEVRLVRLLASFSAEPGELELFYTRAGDAGFSAGKRVIGVPQNDGSVLYALPAGAVADLRLDPGTRSANTVAAVSLQLNPRLPAGRYLLPGLRALAGFALWPALALCAFYSILEGVRLLAARRAERPAAR